MPENTFAFRFWFWHLENVITAVASAQVDKVTISGVVAVRCLRVHRHQLPHVYVLRTKLQVVATSNFSWRISRKILVYAFKQMVEYVHRSKNNAFANILKGVQRVWVNPTESRCLSDGIDLVARLHHVDQRIVRRLVVQWHQIRKVPVCKLSIQFSRSNAVRLFRQHC